MTSDFIICVHALVYLNHKATVLSSDDLAANICTNPARVRKALGPLRRAGLVDAKEGPRGGYAIARPAAEVTLADVAAALEATFVSASWKSGDADRDCLVSSGMAEVVDGICSELDLACKQRLAQTTIADIDRQLFG